MSKAKQKLQTDIQNGLKQVDEGIAQLEVLEGKVENASTISIKEKYRQDMKREIKRLQRLRDMFRQNVSNPAIADQNRLVEARKRIETEMEKFRDHEKEYKSKKPTKAAMLNETEIKGKFNFGSGSDFDGDYDNENEDLNESDGEMEDSNEEPDIVVDKAWLANFITETLRNIIGKYDSELDKIQNKKTKGGQKKNRDKINALKNKKTHMQHIKDRADELQISMDYLEAGKIRQLRLNSKQLSNNHEEEPVRLNVLQEIENLIETSEASRRSNMPQGGNSTNTTNINQSDQSRVIIDQLNLQSTDDFVDDDRPFNSLRIGNILDAQDYLGSWHLSIVIDAGSKDNGDKKTIHFLPFQKANRDEVFAHEDQERIAPAFSKQDSKNNEPQTQVQTLYTYLESHLKKTGQSLPSSGVAGYQRNLNSSAQEETKSRPNMAQNKQGRMGVSSQDDQQQQQRNNTTSLSNNLQQQKGKQAKLQQHQATSGSTMHAEDPSSASKQLKSGGLGARVNGGRDMQHDNSHNQLGQQHNLSSSIEPQDNIEQHDPSARSLPSKTGHHIDDGSELEMTPMFTNSFQGLGEPLKGNDLLPSINLNNGSSLLLEGIDGGLGSLTGTSQAPLVTKDTTSSERRHNLELLEASFNNILTKQDQEVIDPKHPMAVWDEHEYPRVPLFNRRENFSNFDIETLFFAFYYQQGTYQQYLAAIELKKKGWKFVKKFETWFKKVEPEGNPATTTTSANGANPNNTAQMTSNASKLPSPDGSGAAQKDVGKYIFFDFENGWQQLVRDDFELDLSQIENELIVHPAAASPSTAIGGAPATAPTGAPLMQAPTNPANSSGNPSRTTHAQ